MVKNKTLKIKGMSCSNCEFRIEKAVRKIKGILEVKADFQRETAVVKYESDRTTMNDIEVVIEKAGYKIDRTEAKISSINRNTQVLGILVILLSIYLIVSNTIGFNFIPNISPNTGFGMLFVAGLVTSLHCLAMCGGISLSQSISKEVNSGTKLKDKILPGLMYNSGRVISYTVIGGLVGGLGSILTLSGRFKGIIALFSGVLMILMGLNMAGIKVKYIRLDFINKFVAKKAFNGKHKYGRFYIGLLNGLMPCGPLQAMQLYALGTGSIITGSLSMLAFGLGTLPLMMLFSIVSTLISANFTHKMMKVSAALIMILGLIMVNRGFATSGISIGGSLLAKGTSATVKDNVQVINSSFASGKYEAIKVKEGIPVKWVINMAKENINGCNETMNIPDYNITKKLVPGENIIEFTPKNTGTIAYSCWMGMINSTITVTQ